MKTIKEKLYKRRIKQPNFLIYNFLGYLRKYTVARKYNLKVTYQDDPRKEKGPYILLSNHASRLDYIFVAIPLLPQRFNFVVGYNEFYRSHLKGIFNLLKEIPKKNFVPDLYPIMEMKRLINNGGRVALFPEGMSSISGGSQPVALGTSKLLKFLNVPVYVASINGGYLVSPKFNLKERKGNVEVTYKKLFDVSQLASLSENEITKILNNTITTDDYKFNMRKQYIYKSDEMLKNAEQLMYRCPFCGEEFTLISNKNILSCSSCNNTIKADEKYNLIFSKPILQRNLKEIYDENRRLIKEEIKDNSFFFEEKVRIGFLPEYKYLKHQNTSEIRGEGILRIDHFGLSFKGNKDNNEFKFHLRLSDIPTYGMCTDASRFYTFLNGEFIEFYPQKNSTIKFLLATEELHRMHDGKWKDYDFYNNKIGE